MPNESSGFQWGSACNVFLLADRRKEVGLPKLLTSSACQPLDEGGRPTEVSAAREYQPLAVSEKAVPEKPWWFMIIGDLRWISFPDGPCAPKHSPG